MLAFAQNAPKETKVDTLTVGVELKIEINHTIRKDRKTARLYKFKNSKIKKELTFKTKNDKSKLA